MVSSLVETAHQFQCKIKFCQFHSYSELRLGSTFPELTAETCTLVVCSATPIKNSLRNIYWLYKRPIPGSYRYWPAKKGWRTFCVPIPQVRKDREILFTPPCQTWKMFPFNLNSLLKEYYVFTFVLWILLEVQKIQGNFSSLLQQKKIQNVLEFNKQTPRAWSNLSHIWITGPLTKIRLSHHSIKIIFSP